MVIGDVPVKYFLWVKVIDCVRCGQSIDLFPGYLLADDSRHTANVLVCSACGELNEVADLQKPGNCSGCAAALVTDGPAKRGRCACPHCGRENAYTRPDLVHLVIGCSPSSISIPLTTGGIRAGSSRSRMPAIWSRLKQSDAAGGP